MRYARPVHGGGTASWSGLRRRVLGDEVVVLVEGDTFLVRMLASVGQSGGHHLVHRLRCALRGELQDGQCLVGLLAADKVDDAPGFIGVTRR